MQEIMDILALAKVDFDEMVQKEIDEIIRTVLNDAGIHFGHPYFNTATMAGIYRMTLKRFANKYEIEFPIKRDEKKNTNTPWWLQN